MSSFEFLTIAVICGVISILNVFLFYRPSSSVALVHFDRFFLFCLSAECNACIPHR